MLITKCPDKNHSWLQWPVTLHAPSSPTFLICHLTLKYFGQANLNPEVVAAKMPPDCTKILNDFEYKWRPEFWSNKDGNYFVLVLSSYPPLLGFYHNIFSMIQDDYHPWIPHITVDKSFWMRVEDEDLTPSECGIKFDEIELCLGKPSLKDEIDPSILNIETINPNKGDAK